MTTIKEFIKVMVQNGLEFFGVYYGSYQSIVADTDDPQKLGRIRVYNRGLFGGDMSAWAWPKGNFAGVGTGFFALPQKGDIVYASFELGNLQYPRWEYGFWSKGTLPTEAAADYGKIDVLKTASGLCLEFNNKDKILTIKHPNGLTIILKEDKIALGGESYKAVLGDLLKTAAEIDKNNLALLTAAINGAVTSPGDGGAALKAAMVAAISAFGNADYSQILSNKVTLI